MGSKPRRRIAVTGGGTAGHILPALAFLEAYQRDAGAEGFFVGCHGGMELQLVPAHSVRLETIPGKPWERQGWLGRINALASLPPGIVAARRILRREKVELVIGTGGYASLGTCIAAKTLGLPVAIHESNVQPGLANRLISTFADLVGVGFEETRRTLGPRAVITGIPARPVVRSLPSIPNFIVLGGSEGSPVLNTEAPRLFSELQRRGLRFTVRHLTGFSDPGVVQRAYDTSGLDARVDGFVDDMGPVYATATFALAAAGALTLAELSACGIPCLLVPTPGTAREHQLSNAGFYSQQTGALTVPPGPWDPGTLASHIEAILNNAKKEGQPSRQGSGGSEQPAAVALVLACERLLDGINPSHN